MVIHLVCNERRRLAKPSQPEGTRWGLTDDMWALQVSCSDLEPAGRPQFSSIVRKATELVHRRNPLPMSDAVVTVSGMYAERCLSTLLNF
jgi:hypothetical protein